MKFTHGGWLQRKGVATFSPVQVFESEVLPDRVRLVAATHPIVDKGSTLQDASLFFEITAPCGGAIRVQAVHHRGRRDPGPRFEIPEGGAPVEVAKTADAIRFRSGSLELRIARNPWRLSFWRVSEGREEELCASEHGDLAYLRTDWTD